MIKSTTTLLLILLYVCKAEAQSAQYKPFEVDLGIVIAFPVNNDLKLGIGAYIEPKYNIHDNVALGLKAEFVAIYSKVAAEINGEEIDINVSGITSIVATSDYYFTTDVLRPFVGVGAGVYLLGDIKYEDNVLSKEHIGSRFGFMPRVGVVAGHFRLALEYNVIAGLTDLNERSYFGLKLGFEIGGGKIH